jgi:hypothetical protein
VEEKFEAMMEKRSKVGGSEWIIAAGRIWPSGELISSRMARASVCSEATGEDCRSGECNSNV